MATTTDPLIEFAQLELLDGDGRHSVDQAGGEGIDRSPRGVAVHQIVEPARRYLGPTGAGITPGQRADTRRQAGRDGSAEIVADLVLAIGPGPQRPRCVDPADVVAQQAFTGSPAGDEGVGETRDDDGMEVQPPSPRVWRHEDAVTEPTVGHVVGVDDGPFELGADGTPERGEVGTV